MLDKKKEYIAEALDEIRDEYIEEAVAAESFRVVKNNGKHRKKMPVYRLAGTVAACLVVVVALSVGVRYSDSEKSALDSSVVGGAAENMTEGIVDEAAPQAEPDLKGESDPGSEPTIMEPTCGEPSGYPVLEEGTVETGASSLMWYEPEEIVAQNIVIVRGSVESLVQVEGTAKVGETENVSYTQATILVEKCLKGDLKAGDRCIIKLPFSVSYQTYYDNDYYGALAKISEGAEGIFMPRVGTPYYFGEGRRYVFLETVEGLSYAEEVYEVPAEGAVTLDDVEAYILDLLP